MMHRIIGLGLLALVGASACWLEDTTVVAVDDVGKRQVISTTYWMNSTGSYRRPRVYGGLKVSVSSLYQLRLGKWS